MTTLMLIGALFLQEHTLPHQKCIAQFSRLIEILKPDDIDQVREAIRRNEIAFKWREDWQAWVLECETVTLGYSGHVASPKFIDAKIDRSSVSRTDDELIEETRSVIRALEVPGDRFEFRMVREAAGAVYSSRVEVTGYVGLMRSTQRLSFQYGRDSKALEVAYLMRPMKVEQYRNSVELSASDALRVAWEAYLANEPYSVTNGVEPTLWIGDLTESHKPFTNYSCSVERDLAAGIGIPFYRVRFTPYDRRNARSSGQTLYIDARDGRVLIHNHYQLKNGVVSEPIVMKWPMSVSIGRGSVKLGSFASGKPTGKRVQVENFAGYWDTKTDRLWLSTDGKEWRSFKLSGAAAKELDKRPTPKSPFKS